MKLLYMLLLTPLFCVSTAVQCPDSSQWKIRESGLCNATLKWYFCLYDKNQMQYVEFCGPKPHLQRSGYKFIIRGDLDGLQCNTSRYQPITFWTNGSSECIFKKSSCSMEGLVIHSEGNSTSDNTCRCDYKNGYAFVNRPKEKCFCDPILEDCSCYKKTCGKSQVLTPDYNCISIADWNGIFNCSVIKKQRTELESSESGKPNTELLLPAIEGYKQKHISFAVSVLLFILLIGIPMLVTLGSLQQNSESYGYNEMIPAEIREAYKKIIANWFNDDKKFIVTRATSEIEKRLLDNNCVLVVGSSGNGKSAIIRHLALNLKRQGYEIVPFVNDPSNILQYHDPVKKQLFIIDDFCGKGVINAQTVEMWSLLIDAVLDLVIKNHRHTNRAQKKGEVKLLFATPQDVYEDIIFNRVDCLSRYKFYLSELPLLETEKKQMFDTYLPEKKLSDYFTRMIQEQEDIFPLMCKYSEGKTAEQMIQLFKNPFDTIRDDILALYQTNRDHLCLIALCVLLERLPVDTFFKTPEINQQLINGVCSYFNLDISKAHTRSRLHAELTQLESNYLSKSGDSYQLQHKVIHDIAAVVCGKMMTAIFIRFASSSFIAERYSFSLTETNERTYYILINDEQIETEYFDRLVNDLEQMITYSTFHNSQLENESYRVKFCAYCERRKQQLVEILNCLQKDNTNVYEDYIEYTKQFYFSSHNMKIPLIESAWEGHEEIVNMLIEMKRDVNEIDRFGRSALFVACYLGRTNVAIQLLKMGAKHSLCDEKDTSPLHVACKGGYLKIVEVLLEKGADISARDTHGYSPLLLASEAGHTKIVEKLLHASEENSVNIFQLDNFDRSALFLASKNGRKEVVDLLLKNGAELEECDKSGLSPLLAACSKGKFNVVTDLLNAKSNVKTVDNNGRSALVIACQNRYNRIVDILLQHKADVFQCDSQCQSPLFIACDLGDKKNVRSLVKHHADIAQCDKNGRSPLFVACDKGYASICDILFPKCNVEVLEKTDNKNRSPLYAACRGGYLGIVKRLVFLGAQINKCNDWQMTPLLVACREGHVDVVQYLITEKADLNFPDYNKQSPLSVACECGYPAVVAILLKHGSDCNHKDSDNKTPLKLAKIRKHDNIVDILKEHIKRS